MEPVISTRSQTRRNIIGADFLILSIMCMVALVLGCQATLAGPGVGPDSVSYISGAKNLLEGRGYVADLAGPFDREPQRPLYSWPPGYPFLIAGLIGLGLEPVNAARTVSILSFVGLIITVFSLGVHFGGRTFAICATLLTLTLMPVVRLATFALSEMAFTFFSVSTVACIVVWSEHIDSGEKKWLLLAGFFTGISLLIRYVGIVWVAAGLIVIFSRHRFRIKNLLTDGAIFVALALTPVMPWLIRNKVGTGHFTGMDRSQGYHPAISENLRALAQTLIYDFVPSIHFGIKDSISRLIQNPFLFIGLLLIAIAVLGIWLSIHTDRTKKLFATAKFFKIYWIPILYSSAYISFLFVSSATTLFPLYDWPRYLTPVYPLIIITGLASLKTVIISFFDRDETAWPIIMIILTALWVIPNSWQTFGFARAAADGQELTSVAWRTNQGISFLRDTLNPEDVVFSDKPYTIVHFLDRPARYLPYADNNEQVYRFLSETPISRVTPEVAYILVFKGDQGEPDPFFRTRLTYDDIISFDKQSNKFELVADFSDSAVFRLGR